MTIREKEILYLENQWDTRSKLPGASLNKISIGAVLDMAQNPADVSKDQSPSIIPSVHFDHHKARKSKQLLEFGRYPMICGDVDKGNKSLDEIASALANVIGDVWTLIYASKSATDDDRRWRFILPLSGEIPAADYGETVAALNDLLTDQGLVLDRSLEGVAQTVKLPNRGAFYEHREIEGWPLDVGASTSLQAKLAERQAEYKRQAAAAAEAREKARQKRLQYGDGDSPIDAFNVGNSLEMMLERCGYIHHHGPNWISPNSQSRGASVRVYDDRWISLTTSDEGIGIEHGGYQSGDAFDLFVHYEHQGDFSAAVKAYGDEIDVSKNREQLEMREHGARVWASLQANKPTEARVDTVPGVLGEVVEYFNKRGSNRQPSFAVATAISLGSVLMGRRWTTDQDNFTCLYLLCTGETGCGKEQIKTVINELLTGADLGELLGGDGYTSAPAVNSALLSKPNHVSVMDEFGKVMATARSQRNSIAESAFNRLMSVFGACASVLSQTSYSAAALSDKQREALERVVRRPSITLVGLTTPDTLTSALTGDDVMSGLLNRFLIVPADSGYQGFDLRRRRERIEPSETLLNWMKETANAGGENLLADNGPEFPPDPIKVPFTDAALDALEEFQAIVGAAIEDAPNHRDMYKRSVEKAMRVALIIARSKGETEISAESVHWAQNWVWRADVHAVGVVADNVAENDFHRQCKAALSVIKAKGSEGATVREIGRVRPIIKRMKPRERAEMMEAVVADYGVLSETVLPGANGGRPTVRYFANAGGDEW